MSELAFDLRSYQHLNFKVAESKAVDDLSALVLEASANHPRVVYWETTANKILEGLDPTDPTSQTTIEIHRLMQESGDQHVIVWISPPVNYPETRVNLYVNSGSESYCNYSVSTKHSEADCSQIISGLQRVGDSLAPGSPIRIEVPKEIDPLEYVQTYIPLPPELWDDIFSGEAQQRRQQAVAVAQTIAPALIHELRSGSNYLRAGAMAELYMASFGFAMQTRGSGCGLSNLDALSRFGQPTVTMLPKFETQTSTCVEIECTVCHWKPDSEQLKQLENKTLTRCPKCEPKS